MTDVTRWGVPETKCTRCYGAPLYIFFKNSELVLTPSTIFGWERDYNSSISFLMLHHHVANNVTHVELQALIKLKNEQGKHSLNDERNYKTLIHQCEEVSLGTADVMDLKIWDLASWSSEKCFFMKFHCPLNLVHHCCIVKFKVLTFCSCQNIWFLFFISSKHIVLVGDHHVNICIYMYTICTSTTCRLIWTLT